MPPTTVRRLRTMATERWRRSSTRRDMYSRGMLGSCREKMFFSAINLRGTERRRDLSQDKTNLGGAVKC